MHRAAQAADGFVRRNPAQGDWQIEAGACGLPVFTSAAGSIRDYVTEAGAVIAPPKDPEYLIDALVAAAGDRTRLRAMGRAARLQAEQFAWPRVAERMRAVYARILG